MFSTKDFIEASRRFVCIRIETYENSESERLVKKVVGRLANTSFAIMNPKGTRMLTRGSRSPSMSLSDNRGKTDTTGNENAELIGKMVRIAKRYEPQGDLSEPELQDFHSLRQALNCASADQRLLVYVRVPDGEAEQVAAKLKPIFGDEQIAGKFHLDFANSDSDNGWAKMVSGAKDRTGITIIRSGKFGLDGESMEQLAVDADAEEIKAALLKSNQEFAGVEQRKDYQSHVRSGRRQRINFENEIKQPANEGKRQRRKR